MIKTYTVVATVNYPDQTDVQTPDCVCSSIDTACHWLRTLLTSEPEATSYLITIVPQKE